MSLWGDLGGGGRVWFSGILADEELDLGILASWAKRTRFAGGFRV